jgi:transposase-like protein
VKAAWLGHELYLGDAVFTLDEDDSAEEDARTETEAVVVCPHCGEANSIVLDPGSGSTQEYVEDCQVCCQPWRVRVSYRADGSAEVSAEPLVE